MKNLERFFRPRSVAVIGATEAPSSVGRAIWHNLQTSSFQGALYPVNAKRDTVLGKKAYPHVGDIKSHVDLAVIATPAPTVPDVVRECVAKGIRAGIVISAGFREAGKRGRELEQQVLEEARRGGMRIIGPNCLGVMSPFSGLNATFAAGSAQAGNVAFVSQSGALCTAVLDWSLRNNVGFSAFVSVGSMVDVGWGDLIDYFADDPHTKSILLYIESIDDARSFLSAARAAAFSKPIIAVKAGRTEAAAKAAASHTGALTGSDAVLDAAFRRCGVLRVNRISDLFYMANVLSKQPRPAGPKLLIVTNAGGPAVLAADALIESGGELAEVKSETIASLSEFLPPHWSHSNPVDILGDAGAERFLKTLNVLSAEADADGLLVVVSPQLMTSASQIAEGLAPHAHWPGKPVLASFMGGSSVQGGIEIIEKAGIPNFGFADSASRAFAIMWQYSQNVRSLYETPERVAGEADRATAEAVMEAARASGRTLLTESEAKAVLQAYRIPVTETKVAQSEDEAVAFAQGFGLPAVLKLHSETVTHKSESGGVRLDLATETQVREAYRAIRLIPGCDGVAVQKMVNRKKGVEVIAGCSVDPQFGPVLLFGSGGEFVELYQDRALALPPLNTTLARRMMEQTRIYKAFGGFRGKPPVDAHAVEQALVRISRLVLDFPIIQEMDVNPLLVSEEGAVALDARIVVAAKDADLSRIPRPAIRPYPAQYTGFATMRDGTKTRIRPIRAEDEPLIVEFHTTLSDQTVYSRYFGYMRLSDRVAHDRLVRICFVDYDREMALVSEIDGKIRGVARLIGEGDGSKAEFAMVVSDAVQGQGLGKLLLNRLVDVARAEGIREVNGEILGTNRNMLRLVASCGFEITDNPDEGTVTAKVRL